ncbi:Protein of unknown function [Dethiosulfatibacter aminovorans DSM 17477]|uniref:Uncharacterized protein n=1 Tax=Dethiosulfatibacter aminovorans DSM 17477 TaxID=1121476 RepID=A0A1M6MDK6_9FIRM|nr:questin oxidase family protein [Dethiosulfatibacter aminovorans]SHJ81545.1 Protein of unknown function [Dethiosulfatibacter aminovorans DSM 17477]
MKIADLINKYGEIYTPYMSGLVNHLPMVQLALYKMTDDMDYVEKYTEDYLVKSRMDSINENHEVIGSIEECLGKREMYEACLDKIRSKSKEQNLDDLIGYILNRYPLGMSSALFHTTIRLAYGVEGMDIDSDLEAEVERALAFYITAYREGDVFSRAISKEEVVPEMHRLLENEEINRIRKSDSGLGQKIKDLYNLEGYKNLGFIIKGTESEKVKGLFEILIPAYRNGKSIRVLHCMTGLQALVVLKRYFDNYEEVLDIMTTLIITHLLTEDGLDIKNSDKRAVLKTWEEIFQKGSKSMDVHTVKLAYTCEKMDRLFHISELRYMAAKVVGY